MLISQAGLSARTRDPALSGLAASVWLQDRRGMPYLRPMTQAVPLAKPGETEAERQARHVWEAERIAEARADIAAGRLVGSAKVRAWIDSIGTDHEMPVPRSGRWLGGAVPRSLYFTDEALDDLDAVRSWLTQPGSVPRARRRLAAIWSSVERLRGILPLAGRPARRSARTAL